MTDDSSSSDQAADPSERRDPILHSAVDKDAPFELLLRFGQDRPYLERQDPAKTSPADLIQKTLQALTLIGIGLYGAIRFGQQLYCDRLGITPEEIGLTYVASISRTAVILTALLAPTATFLSLLVLHGMVKGTTRLTRAVERSVGVIPGIVLLLALYLMEKQLGRAGIFLLGITSILSIVVYGIIAYVISRRSFLRKRMPFEIRRDEDFTRFFHPYRTSLIILALIGVTTFTGFSLAGLAAVEQVADVQAGRRSEGGRGLGILGLRADHVRLIGDFTEEPSLTRKRLMYLGRSEGKIVLFDVLCQQPLRLADDAITLVTVPDFPPDAEQTCNPIARFN